MKVALIHDWITGRRGGEKVLEVFCELYPEADIFTLIHNQGTGGPIIEKHRIYESFITRFPLARKKYRHYLPLFPTAVEKFDLRQYDLVISSSHCVAKGVITKPDTVHVSYVHSPMRYVWDLYYDYFGKNKVGALQRVFIAAAANYLRTWDVTSSERVDVLIANSSFVARRIKKYWGKDATVIYPPVSLERFSVGSPGDYYLIVSALVPYKRIDIAIKAFNQLALNLKVVGTGPELGYLKSLAGPTVDMLGYQDDLAVQKLYSSARGFVFPGEEDFGITALEALASGSPVIAYKGGGVREIIEDGKWGILFDHQSPESLAEAIRLNEKKQWDVAALHERAQEFEREIFKRSIKELIDVAVTARC